MQVGRKGCRKSGVRQFFLNIKSIGAYLLGFNLFARPVTHVSRPLIPTLPLSTCRDETVRFLRLFSVTCKKTCDLLRKCKTERYDI